MHKNNTTKLKTSSERLVKARPAKKSPPSRKASNGKPTPTKRSRTPRTSDGNSTSNESLKLNLEREERLQQAIDLNRNGSSNDAAIILQKLVEEFAEEAPLWWYLGGIYQYGLKQPAKAIRCFRKATALKPKSERSSLGLFHALWDLDRVDEALAEIGRFQMLTNWSCKDYLSIVAELAEKWGDTPKARAKSIKKRATT
jgi:predicted Zn-dependent protease